MADHALATTFITSCLAASSLDYILPKLVCFVGLVLGLGAGVEGVRVSSNISNLKTCICICICICVSACICVCIRVENAMGRLSLLD
jgi:hypothetical protein